MLTNMEEAVSNETKQSGGIWVSLIHGQDRFPATPVLYLLDATRTQIIVLDLGM